MRASYLLVFCSVAGQVLEKQPVGREYEGVKPSGILQLRPIWCPLQGPQESPPSPILTYAFDINHSSRGSWGSWGPR